MANAALVSAHIGRGDLDQAEVLLGQIGASTSPSYEASALLLRARLALLRGHAEEAARLARESLLALQAYALGGFEPARLVLAESLWALGARSDALLEIKAARADLLSRAEKIGEEAYMKSFLERNRTNARILALSREWLMDA